MTPTKAAICQKCQYGYHSRMRHRKHSI